MIHIYKDRLDKIEIEFDILEIANTLALEDFLVIADIEKTFDSVNHCFLLQNLQNLVSILLVGLKQF